MLTIALLTFREAIRKKIIVLAALLTAGFIALYGTGLHFAGESMTGIGSGNQAMRSAFGTQFLVMGLFLGSFISSVTAVFASVGAISSELDSGVLHAILTRPIRRFDIVLGKFLGSAGLVVPFSAILFLAVVSLAKHFVGAQPASLPPALALFCLQPILLLSVSLFFSTFLSTLGGGIASFALYALGFIGGFIEQMGAIMSIPTMIRSGIVTSLIIPSDSLYRKAIALLCTTSGSPLEALRFGPFGTVSQPSSWMIGYATAYLLIALLAAVTIFRRRDV